MDIKDKLMRLQNAIMASGGVIDSLVPFFFLLKMENKVFNLEYHYQFEHAFKLQRPKREVYMCSRQVGKSYTISGRNLLLSWLIPEYRTLFVLPRYEQAKRLSDDVVKILVDASPFKGFFVDNSCSRTALKRSYLNQSLQYFQYAFLDAERIRGISGIQDLYLDEVQDINWDFIPVIDETTSGIKKWGFKTFTGTPKTLDNTLTALWGDSSQAEWVIKCAHCNKFNIPSIDEDIIKMIGKTTCVCANPKCGKALDCAKGQFVHRFPDKKHVMPGYHISQITHPIHYAIEDKWVELHYKMRMYPKSKFYNEILGIPCDSAEKLISMTEIQMACAPAQSEYVNTLEHALRRRQIMDLVIIGIDWGGGGEESSSYTAMCVLGLRPGSDVLEVIYGAKFNRNVPPVEQTQKILQLIQAFKPTFLAHDYGGAGADKEAMLIQAGFPLEKIAPFTYVTSSAKPIIYYNPPSIGYRHSYNLDKMRSIVVLTHMIRAKKIIFPTWETMQVCDTEPGEASLLRDFLYINLERVERPRGADVMQITKTPKMSDDFVHAVNYASSCAWYVKQCYPNIAEAQAMRMSQDTIEQINPVSPLTVT